MDTLRLFIGRYQMAIFVLLAYVFSWALIIPADGGLIPHGPMIAAFIVLAVVSGRRGVSGLWQQMTRWRVEWKWYLLAPGIFIALHLSTLLISLAFGARITNTAHLQSPPAYLGVVVPLLLFGGQWEEPGWTGFALRRIQERIPQAPLVASLVTALIRMVWHTPLLLYGTIPWYDFIFYSFALQLILSWLYNRSDGSVLIVMIGHLFSNLVFATVYPLLSISDQGQYWMLFVIIAWVYVLGLLIATRGDLSARKERMPETAIS